MNESIAASLLTTVLPIMNVNYTHYLVHKTSCSDKCSLPCMVTLSCSREEKEREKKSNFSQMFVNKCIQYNMENFVLDCFIFICVTVIA